MFTLIDFEPDPFGSLIVYACDKKVGYLEVSPATHVWWFVHNDENFAPIFAEELQEIIDKLNELNRVKS